MFGPNKANYNMNCVTLENQQTPIVSDIKFLYIYISD